MQRKSDSAPTPPAQAPAHSAPELSLGPYALLGDAGRLWLQRIWRVCLTLLVVLGLIWAIGSWYLVNFIDDWRPRLEQALSALWHRPVRIAQLQADYDGIVPELQVHGLQVASDDPHAPPLLAIDFFQANSNVFLLFQRQFSRLSARGVQIQITRLRPTQWQFGGFVVDMAAPSTIDPLAVSDAIFSQRRVRVQDLRIRWEDRASAALDPPLRAATVHTAGPLQITMENKGPAHSLSLQGQLPPGLGSDLNLLATFRAPKGLAHPGDIWAWQGQIKLHNESLQLARLQTLLQPFVSLPLQLRAGSVDKLQLQLSYAGLPPVAASAAFAPSRPKPSLPDLLPRLHWQGSVQLNDLSIASKDQTYRLQTPARGMQLQLQFKDFAGQGQLQLRASDLALGPQLVAKQLHLQTLATPFSFQLRSVAGEPWPSRAALTLERLTISNDDLALSARVAWNSWASTATSTATSALGTLAIDGKVARAKLGTLVNYFPQVSGADVLRYLQAALGQGEITNGVIRIHGPVAHVPAFDAHEGQFTISAQLHNGTFNYLPDYVYGVGQARKNKPWPALEKLNAQFFMDGKKLELTQGQGQLLGYAQIAVKNIKAQFADIRNLNLNLTFDADAQAKEALHLLANSALADLTQNATASLQATGPLALNMALNIPIQTPERTRVTGLLTLKGNTLRVSPQVPQVQQLVGTLELNEKGFHIPQARAVALGGAIQVSGGMPAAIGSKDPATLSLKIQGLMHAAQLREQTELGLPARVAQLMTGQTPFNLALRLVQDRLNIEVSSTLEGMQLKLPAPFKKEPRTHMPVVFRLRPNAESDNTSGDTVELTIGHPENAARKLLAMRYQRSDGPSPKVLGGEIAVNLAEDESPSHIPGVVSASIHLDQMPVGEWLQVIHTLQRGATAALAKTDADPVDANAALPTVDVNDSYLPNVWALRSHELSVNDRVVHNLTLAGSREGRVWTMSGLADEFSGYAQYDQGSDHMPATMSARLERLHLGKSEVRHIDGLIDKVESEPTTTLPDLDVEIADLQLDNLKFGRVELLARNTLDTAPSADPVASAPDAPQASAPLLALQDRTWVLHKLHVSRPNAQAKVEGSWQWLASDIQKGNSEKRVRLQFDVNTDNLGQVLTDFALPDTVNRGSGQVYGSVTWLGSPFAVNYPRLGGQVSVHMRNGQILSVDPGALKLLGIFSLQFLPRLLSLNLNSELQQGFTFDSISGDAVIRKGVAHVDNLALKNSSLANVDISGTVDLVHNQYDLLAQVTPQVNFGSAALVASAFLGPTQLALLPVQWLLSKALSRGAERYWQVRGPLNAPQMVQLLGPNGPPTASDGAGPYPPKSNSATDDATGDEPVAPSAP